ncbi:hypothetical protein NHX12_011803 [Muraenolepis orangiensis]|uniref:Pre-rRNA-processing protein TSR2 homolog n=1 Tax=Muraenolepis orangiensis TaxID=630683 RepID=A0A9Q0DGY0_9TELE|nr:hypothetical protein NHX12_011803 [Muraenolepis orangiensis]
MSARKRHGLDCSVSTRHPCSETTWTPPLLHEKCLYTQSECYYQPGQYYSNMWYYDVFKIAVDSGFGGAYGQQKAEWMVDVVQKYFYENSDLDPTEVEDYISVLLDQEFNTVADDGSLAKLSQQLCSLFSECQQGAMASVRQTVASIVQNNSGRAKVTVLTDEESEEETQVELQDRWRWSYSTGGGGATGQVEVELQDRWRWSYSTCGGGATVQVELQVEVELEYRWSYSTGGGEAAIQVEVELQHRWSYSGGGATGQVEVELQYRWRWSYRTGGGGATGQVEVELQYMWRWSYSTGGATGGGGARVQVELQYRWR